MTAPTTLVLVRHGETAGNREGRFQTYDTPLSPEGRAQAMLLAERLAVEPPVEALYASDLRRAMETAEILGARLALTPVPCAGLRELDVGDWKGLHRSEVIALYPGGFAGWLAAGAISPLPGDAGECSEDVAVRARAALDAIAARHAGGRVLAVSHGLTLAITLAGIHGWDRTETLRTGRAAQGNTAVNVVEVDHDGSWRCLLLGCVRHLEAPSTEARAV